MYIQKVQYVDLYFIFNCEFLIYILIFSIIIFLGDREKNQSYFHNPNTILLPFLCDFTSAFFMVLGIFTISIFAVSAFAVSFFAT